MHSTYSSQYTKSLFDEADATIVAYRVYDLLKDPIDWKNAHHGENYLDMVKDKYRTFEMEYPNTEGAGKLPSMFTEEFGPELYKYNRLVDRYCNEFEVIAEKRVDGIYFTHGWSNIRTCYVDAVGKGGWASITYIKPKLFVLVLKDRYYRDLIVKQLYPHVSLKLSRFLFGPDENPGWGGSVFMPYCHDSGNFAHSFVVILSEADVSSKSLTVYYGNFASKVFSTEGGSVKLIDEKGVEWTCTVEYSALPYQHVKVSGEWRSMVRARNYTEGAHIMFGSPTLGYVRQLFVKKRY
ncbi:hypothetical protein QL285_038864 [Trifolium repens]|nr:hypothetical protein QL285_038864 [Trifolium repens]